MYWVLVAGFSGACERRSSGAQRNSKNANIRRVIFIRKRILALSCGVIGAQRSFARAQDKTASPIKAEAELFLFFFLLFLQNGGGGDGVVFFQAQQPDALRR